MNALRNGFAEASPYLRLFASALWMAWITIFYSGDCVVVPLGTAYATTSMAFPLSTIGIGFVLVVAASFPREAEALLGSRPVRILAAVLAAAGTVGVGFAGALPAWLLYLSAVISGISTGVVALIAACIHAELDTKSAIITSCLSLIAGTLLYAFSTMCAMYFSPGVVLAVAALLPALGIALGSLPGPQAAERGDDAALALSPSFWRIIVFCGMLLFVMSSVRAYYPQLIDSGDFSVSRGMVAAGLIICAALIACIAAVHPKTSSFARFFYLLLVLPVVALAPIAILGPGSSVSGAVGGIINGVVSMVAWALLASISSRSGMSPVRVFGFGYGVIALSMVAGFTVGDLFGEIISSQFNGLAGVLFLVVFVGAAMLLVHRRDIEASMTPTAAVLSELESLSGEDAEAAAPADVDVDAEGENAEVDEEADSPEAPRPGKFRQRCLLIAEEYGLSARETEVFLLLAKNKEARAIADELFVSFNTVRTHIKNIYMKLDVHNRRELQDVIDSFAK
ncbi:MAG: helix-turn-helix transcriptional regulator [Eggerthellaceae bacterium]|nr:helix-turn-helix transcriptional regulator [Eggerthellaceae bacterium]